MALGTGSEIPGLLELTSHGERQTRKKCSGMKYAVRQMARSAGRKTRAEGSVRSAESSPMHQEARRASRKDKGQQQELEGHPQGPDCASLVATARLHPTEEEASEPRSLGLTSKVSSRGSEPHRGVWNVPKLHVTCSKRQKGPFLPICFCPIIFISKKQKEAWFAL